MYKILSNKDENTTKFINNFSFVIAVLLSVAGFLWFFISTGLVNNLFLLILLSAIIVYPFRSNKLLLPYFVCCLILFICGILQALGSTIVPFIIAFIIGYLLDPFVSFLEKRKIPRWLSSLALIFIAGGIIILIAVFVFPLLFEQASTIAKQINNYIKDIKDFSTNKSTNAFLKQLGIQISTWENALNTNIWPIIENWSSKIFATILNLLLKISNIATQIINVVILPFLTFYFLNDFSKIRKKIPEVINNKIVINYLRRFNKLIRTYIGWQITASIIVTTISSIVLTILDVPYSILIACIAGILNPIPYFGMIFSILISVVIMLFAADSSFYSNMIAITANLFAIHFVNAYLIEPSFVGNKIGLHPILMILSVFVFNALFGVLGMLIAVPITALVVSFVKDFYHYRKELKTQEQEP